jgi:hypothetical protein
VQERVHAAALSDRFDPSGTAAYVAGRALPAIREITVACGPEKLALAAAEDGASFRGEEMVGRWLAGGELSAVDLYLARAAGGPVLEAMGRAAGEACAGPRDPRHCPRCGGLPQLSVFSPSGEDLVAPRRYLECARCAWRWGYPRLTCPGCGETSTGQLPIFAEEGTTLLEVTGQAVRGVSGKRDGPPSGSGPRFPHLSVHACRSCPRYLLNVDLEREARAVPTVDEMAAIPLDLYAREHGLKKIAPNLMGL